MLSDKWWRFIVSYYSNNVESVCLRKCPYDDWFTNKGYLIAITVTNIYESFTCKMAAKINWHMEQITSLSPILYKTFWKFKFGLSNRREKLVRFMVFRVEYDRSHRVCIGRTGNRPSQAVAQGGQFFYRGPVPLCPPPLAPALDSAAAAGLAPWPCHVARLSTLARSWSRHTGHSGNLLLRLSIITGTHKTPQYMY